MENRPFQQLVNRRGNMVEQFCCYQPEKLCAPSQRCSVREAWPRRRLAFFMHRGGRALTASEVNDLLRTALPGQGISSHSLRIGGATTASKRGISDHALKAAGRWSSEAFRSYIRHNADDQRAVSLILA